jgi:hypothetical protein
MPTVPGGHAAVRTPGTTDVPPAGDRTTDIPVPPPAQTPAVDTNVLLVPTARPAPLGAPSVAPSSTKMRSTLPYVATRARNVEESEAHVEAALEASTRAEASLSALLNAIHQVTTGVSGAREANDALVAELQSAREMLRTTNERRLALERRIALVEQERDALRLAGEELRASATHDRTFLMEEQDRFLQAVMEEHEVALAELVRERDEAREQAARVTSGLLGIPARNSSAPTNPNLPVPSEDAQKLGQSLGEARRTIERLVAERDRARDVLRRLQTQRDEAQDAVDRLTREVDEVRDALARQVEERASLVTGSERQNPDGKRTDPVPPIMERPTFPVPPPAQHAAIAASRIPTPPGPLPALGPIHVQLPSKPTPPPEELRGALFTSDAPPESGRATPETHPIALALPPALDPEAGRATPLPDEGPQITIKRPPLKPKPDPASHSLGGYSMAGEAVESDRIDTARIRTSKPPQR